MADTMDVSQIATVLPKELNLGVPPKMPQARSYLFRQQSTLASTSPTGTVTINIPRLQRSYLRKDSYLRFRVNGSWTPSDATLGKLHLDSAGAYGFFDRIEIFDYLGSTVLESISGIPQLSALLMDMGMKEFVDGKNGTAGAGLGFDYSVNGSGMRTPGPGATTGATTAGTGRISQGGFVFSATAGSLVASSAGSGITVPFTHEFCIPLPSFLGLLSDKMVPLHNGFTIVLTLSTRRMPFFISANQDTAISVTTVPAVSGVAYTNPTYAEPQDGALQWELTDCAMNCQILELGPVAESMIMSSTQGTPLVVYTKSFRNYVGVIKGATWPAANVTYATSTADIVFPYIVSTSNDAVTTTGAVSSPGTITANATGYTNINELRAAVQTAMGGTFQVNTTGNRLVISNSTAFVVAAGDGWAGLNIAVGSQTTGNVAPTSTGQSEFVLNMNLNVASLTDILWIMRPSSQLDSLLYQSYGNRTRNFLQRWQLQYGSTILPQSNGIQAMSNYIPSRYGAVTSSGITKSKAYEFASIGCLESFQELMKSRPVTLAHSRIDDQSYGWDAKFNDNLDKRSTADNVQLVNLNGIMPSATSSIGMGRFAAGLNLQLANNHEGIISGLNTNGMNTSIRGIFHPTYTDIMDSVRVDAWAEYDSFVNISPGIATTVSF
jgi:hypothetical protein